MNRALRRAALAALGLAAFAAGAAAQDKYPSREITLMVPFAAGGGTDQVGRAIAEALNHAVRNIPPEQMRMHLCWGNYEAPHQMDVPLADIIDVVFLARPSAISFEAANPRHAHEWAVFEKVKLPDGKMLIPGVLESKSNFIEHPELIAQRIGRYAKLVGRENVMAGSDCGYGTWVGQAAVDPDVVWGKMAAMAEGARLASKQFWGKAAVSV